MLGLFTERKSKRGPEERESEYEHWPRAHLQGALDETAARVEVEASAGLAAHAGDDLCERTSTLTLACIERKRENPERQRTLPRRRMRRRARARFFLTRSTDLTIAAGPPDCQRS